MFLDWIINSNIISPFNLYMDCIYRAVLKCLSLVCSYYRLNTVAISAVLRLRASCTLGTFSTIFYKAEQLLRLHSCLPVHQVLFGKGVYLLEKGMREVKPFLTELTVCSWQTVSIPLKWWISAWEVTLIGMFYYNVWFQCWITSIWDSPFWFLIQSQSIIWSVIKGQEFALYESTAFLLSRSRSMIGGKSVYFCG